GRRRVQRVIQVEANALAIIDRKQRVGGVGLDDPAVDAGSELMAGIIVELGYPEAKITQRPRDPDIPRHKAGGVAVERSKRAGMEMIVMAVGDVDEVDAIADG